MQPNETATLVARKIMSPDLKARIDGAGGAVSQKDLRAMGRATGVGIENLADFLPFGVRHLVSKSQMKVVKAEYGERRAEQKKLLKQQLAAEKAEKRAQAERRKSEHAELKAVERRATLEKKEAEKLEKQQATAAAQSLRRREELEQKLRVGADIVESADTSDTVARWEAKPAETRYKAVQRLQTKQPGYLQVARCTRQNTMAITATTYEIEDRAIFKLLLGVSIHIGDRCEVSKLNAPGSHTYETTVMLGSVWICLDSVGVFVGVGGGRSLRSAT